MLGAMSTRHQIDAGRSRFTAQAFAGGLLSFFAHSPKFAVRDFAASCSGALARHMGLGLKCSSAPTHWR
jgi:hypothetical protein